MLSLIAKRISFLFSKCKPFLSSIATFLSSLATIATFCTVYLLYMQIVQQQELFDITQKTQFQIIIREPCQSKELKYPALDALIQIDRRYHRSPDLRWVQLKEASLKGFDLKNVNLSDSDLSATDLAGAKMDGAILQNAKYNNRTKFPEGFNIDNKGLEKVDGPTKDHDCPK